MPIDDREVRPPVEDGAPLLHPDPPKIGDHPAATELPPTATTLVTKVDDLDEVRSVLVDAAGVSLGLWLSYLFVLFYFLIAAGGVTHRDLFLENPVKLPFLNVDLPLKSFFWIGPALFIVVHLYVLLHMVMLAEKIRIFDAKLRDQIKIDEELRTRIRRQLPSNLFVMFLAGPREIRDGSIGMWLKIIAWVSFVAGPIVLLVFFQLRFLPYHDPWITWFQRITVVVDLLFLWTFWPGVTRGNTIGSEQPQVAWGTVVAMTCLTAVSFALAFFVATFPGEWWQNRLESLGLAPNLMHRMLLAGELDPVLLESAMPFSDHLILSYVDVIDHAKFDTAAKIDVLPVTTALRGRHLEGAILTHAVMQKVDLTGAFLQGAKLDQAILLGASLNYANLKQAWLTNAQLKGASLDGASLDGARLIKAQLQGASLNYAVLLNASLQSAELQAASAYKANFDDAVLDGAKLQGSVLDGASLVRASFLDAQLQGASLVAAILRDASLDRANLQGASFDEADFEGASLSGAFVWRADILRSKTLGARVSGVVVIGMEQCQDDPTRYCNLSTGSSERLTSLIESNVPAGKLRNNAIALIRKRLDPNTSIENETSAAEKWANLSRACLDK